jgi:hypothetical protein
MVIGGCGGGNGGRFAKAEAEAAPVAVPGTPEADGADAADAAACSEPSLADAAFGRAAGGGSPAPWDAPLASDAIASVFGVLVAPLGAP